MNGKPVPLSLAFEQRQSLAALAQVGVSSAFAFMRPKRNPEAFQSIRDIIEPPSDRLIDSYLDWLTTPHERRNARMVPPHMFSQWTIPLATRILLQTCYPLSNIINLGCEVKVNGEIRRGEKLIMHAELANLEETDNRVKFSVRVSTSTTRYPNAIEALSHALLPKQNVFPLETKSRDAFDWECVGRWRVDENDGLRYALLTGDFNPVHWMDFAARLSPFGQKVLHGFGSLSLCWDALQRSEAEANRIRKINVRFSRPVPLPSTEMSVLRSEPKLSGARRVALRAADGGIHLIGEYRAAER
ncbi:MAG TPA: MaoC/PaaZ C-terminal domain-containing protein [Pseudomonadales bacterium]|nr:MaoC/PaaZ C-terminal domain-containing protein [Pseudomonadales bacterium]